MRKIWDIYRLDIKNIVTNVSVLIVIVGLIFLPSLYAWFNIKASWDPYSQTDQIPVGIVNEDIGSTVRGEDIRVGDELVTILEENDSMNWQFVDRDTAMSEVEYGNYYAVMVIPKDFSEKLATVVSGNPEKADMEYYVNEKINAIAPKITDKGVSVIVEEISSEFVSTVNGVIFDMFNQIGLELEKDYPDIQQFKQYIFELEESLPEIHEVLTSTESDATDADGLIAKALEKIPEAESVTNDGLQKINQTIEVLNDVEGKLDEISPIIQADLKKVQDTVHEVNDTLAGLDENDVSFAELKASIDNVDQQVTNVIKELNEAEQSLISVQEELVEENEELASVISEIQAMKTSLQDMQAGSDKVHDYVQEVEKEFKQIVDFDGVSTEKIDQFVTTYTNTIEPTLRAEIKNGKQTLVDAKGLIADIQTTIPEVESLLKNTRNHLGDGQELLTYVLNEFPFVNDKVKETAGKIRNIESETDLNEVINLLKNDPDMEKGFFAEPVVLHKNEIFPIPIYGMGMTPFYTVLAVWVGALLLISLLRTDIGDDESIKPRHMYFGRLLTFLSIGLLQTVIVVLGDVFLLKVEVQSLFWFLIFGLIVSSVFMTIVYTVVSIFGDVGKAMIIILLVLQIAGSGGTYPVALLPEFFQAINPFLPFTYAVDLLREAVGGIVWKRAIIDIVTLVSIGTLFILIGTFLKTPINRFMAKVMGSKGSRLFH